MITALYIGADRMRPNVRHFILVLLFFSLVGLSLSACQKNVQQKVDSLLAQGESCFGNGDYRNALQLWQKALTYNLNRERLLEKIADAHLRLADFKSAYKIISKLADTPSASREILKKAVRINLIVGDLAAAESFMQRLKTAAPDWADTYEALGELMVFRNNLDEARVAFEKCLQLSSGNPFASAKMAQCLLAQGEPVKARTCLQQALGSNGADSQLMTLISNYYKLEGNYGLAEQYLLKAHEADPNSLAVEKVLVEFYYERKKYDLALQHVSKVLAKEKENTAFKLLQVELLLVQNRYEEARSILLKAGDAMADDIDALFLKGKMHLMAGEPLAAIQYLKTVTEMRPSNSTASFLLGVAYLNNKNNHTAMATLKNLLMLSPDNTDADLLLGDVFYKNKEYPISLKYANRVLLREPENYRAHMIIGNCLLAQNRIAEAAASFQSAQKINPDALEPKYYLAVCDETMGRWQEAFDVYLKMVEMHPFILDAGVRCVQLASKHGKLDMLNALILKHKERNPDNGYYDYLLGDSHMAEGKIDEAAAAFELALDIDPKISAAYIKLADIHRMRGNREAQLKVLQAAVKNHPDFIRAYLELSDWFRQKGDFNQSEQTLKAAINAGLQDPVLLNNYAVVLIETGKYSKAFEYARDALKSMPTSAFCMDTLGWAYYHKKLYDQAVWYFKEALKSDFDNPEVHYHLGLTFFELKKNDAAHQHLQLALKNDLPVRSAQKAKAILEKIETGIE